MKDREALIREATEAALLQESAARRFIYADVEELIQHGFLHHRTEIHGVPIVFRTLTPQEAHTFLVRVGESPNWRRWHLAQSVHMVNDWAIEPQYGANHAYHVYHEWVKDIPDSLLDVLYTYLIGLRYRVERAVKLTDAYCHEGYSRSLWRMMRHLSGSLNTVQRLWVAYNEAEDVYEMDLRHWKHTRALSMSAKAAKSIQDAENKWADRRREQAQRIIEDAVNWVISGSLKEKPLIKVTVNGQTYEVRNIHASQSADELHEEMMRAVRGEKDYHDIMIEQYKEFHRRRLEQARKEQQDAIAAAWGHEDEGVHAETSMVGYTREQLAELRPDVLTKRPTQQSHISPEEESFNQYVNQDIKVGWLGVTGMPEEAAFTKPASTETESLQDKISKRAPTLRN